MKEAYSNVVTTVDLNNMQLKALQQQTQQSHRHVTAMHGNQTHNQHMPSGISAVTQHAANLSWKTLPERDEWGHFKPRVAPTLPTSGMNTLGTDSDFQLLSDLEPQSPPDVASTRGLLPS